MLVTFSNVVVTNINPTFSDASEYEVDDGSGAVMSSMEGRIPFPNVPSDTLLGKGLIPAGSRISSLTGIVYFSFNRYKFVPRTMPIWYDNRTSHPRKRIHPGIVCDRPELSDPFNPTTEFRPSACPTPRSQDQDLTCRAEGGDARE